MSKAKKKPGDDFDEKTAVPRQRPVGAVLPRTMSLPPGEDVFESFATWEREGRFPAGSVLARFTGTTDRFGLDSGYEVAGYFGTGQVTGKTFVAGTRLSIEDVEPFRISSEILLKGLPWSESMYVILSPK